MGLEKGKSSQGIVKLPESADFLFSLDLRRACTWAFYSIRSSANSQMALRFLFTRFHDQTANGGCDQDSKEASPLENTERAEFSLHIENVAVQHVGLTQKQSKEAKYPHQESPRKCTEQHNKRRNVKHHPQII